MRYPYEQVQEALELVERGTYEAHACIVLAAEVQALREQYASVDVCPLHNIRLFRSATGFECWHCTYGKQLKEQIDALHADNAQLRATVLAATQCPRDSGALDGTCRYRSIKQAQVEALQASNAQLRDELAVAMLLLGKRG